MEIGGRIGRSADGRNRRGQKLDDSEIKAKGEGLSQSHKICAASSGTIIS